MRFSRYVRTFTYADNPGYLLFYSTKRSSSVLLHESVVQDIEKEELSASDETVLEDLGLLVSDPEEEKKEMLQSIDRVNSRSKRLNAIVVMNLDCNLSCVYCYEEGLKGRRYMSPGAVELLVRFMENRLDQGMSAHIDFYGGEPLLSYEVQLGGNFTRETWKATPKTAPSPCMVELRDDIVINYDGAFYKCPGFIGRKEFETGSLGTGIKDCAGSYKPDLWKNEDCFECAYLPLCFGGCRYMKFLRDGEVDGRDCRKPYLDATLEAFVAQDIKYRRPDGDN